MEVQRDVATLKKVDKYSFSLTVDLIGTGSFGKVYKGKNEETKEIAAIKMIDKKLLESDEYLQKGFSQEIAVMKKLKSVNIVQLYDVLETTNNYYIVCEYCNQGDFRKYLKQNKRLNEDQAKKVLVDILSGFIELVKNGIIHRDLKPENILIANDVFKLADFGFARTVHNFSREMLESLVGTPLYMSPQILMHTNYTTKCDIWSIGNIYFEMLVGRTPWKASSQYELVTRINKEEVKFPDNISISEESKDFIRNCLKVNENERISWDQIYAHRLVKQYFQDYVIKQSQMESQSNFIINQLRQYIYRMKIDLEEIFNDQNLTEKSKLKITDFEKLMISMDPTLSRNEIEYVFNKFGPDRDCEIDFHQFKRWLQSNDVRMSMRSDLDLQQMSVKQQHSNQVTDSEQKKLNMLQEQKVITTIQKLFLAIYKYQIGIDQLFKKFDKSGNNKLNLQEFGEMMRKMDNSLTEDEIKLSFKKFDEQKLGYIDVQQLQSTLQKYSGSKQMTQQQGKSNESAANEHQQQTPQLSKTPSEQKSNQQQHDNSGEAKKQKSV